MNLNHCRARATLSPREKDTHISFGCLVYFLVFLVCKFCEHALDVLCYRVSFFWFCLISLSIICRIFVLCWYFRPGCVHKIWNKSSRYRIGRYRGFRAVSSRSLISHHVWFFRCELSFVSPGQIGSSLRAITSWFRLRVEFLFFVLFGLFLITFTRRDAWLPTRRAPRITLSFHYCLRAPV